MKTQNVVKIGLIAFLLTMLIVSASAGEYYIYSTFPVSGYDVDGWYDSANDRQLLYFDYNGIAYVYEVSIPDGADPNMHPDNPNNTGPIAPRTFTLVETHNIANDIGSYTHSTSEFYVDDSGIYYGPTGQPSAANGKIHKWDHDWNYLGTVVDAPKPNTWLQTLGYDPATNTWYSGTVDDRRIFSFTPGVDTSWQYEFTYPSYAGSHHDGLEFVNGYLWISDMTSDVIAQWQKSGGTWTEVERFTYSYPGFVEGMGFGPFAPPITAGHFWATSGSHLYELGGGGISRAFQPDLVAVDYDMVSGALEGSVYVSSFKVKFENRAEEGDAYNVEATITSAPPNTDFSDDPTVTVGNIPAGGSAWSTDTFTVKVDLAYTPAPDPCDEIFWDVEYNDSLGKHHLLEDVPEFPPGEGPATCP